MYSHVAPREQESSAPSKMSTLRGQRLLRKSSAADNMSDRIVPERRIVLNRRLSIQRSIDGRRRDLLHGGDAACQGAGRLEDGRKAAQVVGRRAGRVLSRCANEARRHTARLSSKHKRSLRGRQHDKATPSPVTRRSAGGWSKLIDAETIETEIKRIGPNVAKADQDAERIQRRRLQGLSPHFSVLATLFAVSAEYDGEVRWQDAAPALRDLFARAGHNCKAGSDQTFQEAVQRKQDLADLIGGTRPKTKEAERKADWAKVADRPPLMQRMNIAHEDRLKKWLANKGEFTAHQRRSQTRGAIGGRDRRHHRPRGLRILGR